MRILPTQFEVISDDGTTAGKSTGITVEQRLPGGWCVYYDGMIYDVDGNPEYDAPEASKDDGFIARTRFHLEQAKDIAGQLFWKESKGR